MDEVVLASEHGLMIKEIIYGRLGLSRGLLRRMKNGGKVCLNGKPAFITQRVKAGDRISIYFADSATKIVPQPMKLDIVYEDDSLLIINKAPHIAVHPTRTYPDGTLANGVAYHWQKQGAARKVRLLHRLDRETSGLILIAKEPYAYHRLVQQLRTRQLRRKYLAVVQGRPEAKVGTIDQPIGRDLNPEGHALKRTVTATGKSARTFYRVIKEYPLVSLLELELVTGRTHQIRVHLKWMGHPIVGDEMYGQASMLIDRQALHAWSLEFTNPRSGQQLKVKAPIPPDIKAILSQQLQQFQ